MYIKQLFLNTIPFIGFLCGHTLVWQLQKPKTILCPSLIGMPLLTASMKATEEKIYIRVIKTVIDESAPEGTILTQYPKEKSLIKEQQIVYVSVSIIPPVIQTPSLLYKKVDDISSLLDASTITIDSHYVYSPSFPTATIFAQHPLPGKIMHNNKLTIYVNKEVDPVYIIPCCIGYSVEEITELFDLNQIPYSLNHQSYTKDSIIIDQRPAKGTVVHKNRLKMIYLHCLT